MKLTFHRFKKRENRRYNYTPRYYEGKKEDNPFAIDSKFYKYRDKANDIDFGAQWKEDRKNSRTRKNREINRTFIYAFVILLFIALWILDFDLSIFTLPIELFR